MKNYVLITGASGGIGLEFAYIFANEGYKLILCARSFDKLKSLSKKLSDLYGIETVPVEIDLSLPGSASELYNRIKSENIIVDILVNNAGFGDSGLFYATNETRDIEMINLNITSLYLLSKLFVKDMIDRKSGKVLNIASVASFMPGPYMALYYASKAFVLSFSLAAYTELKGTGVSVTALCPGPTKSNFFNNANAQGKRVSSMFIMPEARSVALFGYKKMLKGKPYAIHGASNKFMIFLTKVLPANMVASVVGMMQKN